MTQLTINPIDPIGTINPNIYGHFAEHLGRCIYDGIWVGEDSPIPNTDGFRKDVILGAAPASKPPVHPLAGRLLRRRLSLAGRHRPARQRPRRINIHWGEVIETNAVGTQEFVRFCRLVGAEPYICGNVGSGRCASCAIGWNTATSPATAVGRSSAPRMAARRRST